MYRLVNLPQADKDLETLKRNEPNAFKKAKKLLAELMEHPKTGTGRPEQLSGNKVGQWSRRISSRHRLVYIIDDNKVIVVLLAAYGHCNDK